MHAQQVPVPTPTTLPDSREDAQPAKEELLTYLYLSHGTIY